ncbi:MAG: hypothetical protein LBH18_03385 [Spirochaetaceae bacterium]|jgi:hypothetical protein|nr:hypothetical protein [Spirochaetaceae bacterium]
MENKNQIYDIIEKNENMSVSFKRSESGYAFTIKYRDDLLGEFNTEESKYLNHVVDLTKRFNYSKRFYYFKDLIPEIGKFISYLREREEDINKKTDYDYPFFFSAVFHYLSYICKRITDQIAFPTSLQKDSNPLDMNIQLLSLLYPQFKDDYKLLLANGFIEPQEDGFIKLKGKTSKQFLAEYFHSIKPDDKKMDWKTIERIFQTEGLANNLSRNGNEFKNESKSFADWKAIRQNH